MRFQETADQVRFGHVPGVVDAFHLAVKRMPDITREQPCVPEKMSSPEPESPG
jgi:hypothetical protein